MDLKKLKRLVSLVETSGISSLYIEDEKGKIEIKKDSSTLFTQASALPVTSIEQPVLAADIPVEKTAAKETVEASNTFTVLSPMVGTFFSASNPESAPFVTVGKKVNVGDPLCIIEAMKLFNDIESEASGTVEKILVENNTAVEFGQPLYVIRLN